MNGAPSRVWELIPARPAGLFVAALTGSLVVSALVGVVVWLVTS